MRKLLIISTALLFAGSLSACGVSKKAITGSNTKHADLTLYAASDSTGAMQDAVNRCNASNKQIFTLQLQNLPSATDGRRLDLTRRLSAKDSTVDIMAIDSNWNAEFAASGWLMNLTGKDRSAVLEDTLEGPLQAATYKKKLFSVPLTTQTQVIWYRKGTVQKAPQTWDELISESQVLASQKKPHTIALNSSSGESLSLWFNGLVHAAGGTILNAKGQQTITGETATRAAAILKQSASDPFANTADARQLFIDGKAAFLIDDATAFSNQQSSNYVAAQYPRLQVAKPPITTLTGVDLGISEYSKHQRQAIKAANCLHSSESQTRLVQSGNVLPVSSSSYLDKSVEAKYANSRDLMTQVINGVAPPQTPTFSAVSDAIDNALMPIASIDAANVTAKLQTGVDGALSTKANK